MIVPATAENIARAASALAAGELVAFPTETVYGLGANARDAAAIGRLFTTKGRPAEHPVIVHLADAGALPRWAKTVPASAKALAKAFWPGPLTMILPRADGVLDAVTGGQDTVGLRVPAQPIAHSLLAEVAVLGCDGIADADELAERRLKEPIQRAVEGGSFGHEGLLNQLVQQELMRKAWPRPARRQPGHFPTFF